MKRSVTLFVRSRGSYFFANSYASEAIAPTPEQAARLCAARHLDVPVAKISLIPDGDAEHVFVGYFEDKPANAGRPIDWRGIGIAVFAIASAGFVLAVVTIARISLAR